MNEEIFDITKPLGGIIATIEYKTKPKEVYRFPNTVLTKGREALANFLVDQNSQKSVFVQTMLFGDGGVDKERIKKVVNIDRNALFGITRVSKPVVAQIDPMIHTQAIFTAVVTFEDANGFSLNEMALQLNTGDIFSMATFPDLGKTDQMQITFNWRLSIV